MSRQHCFRKQTTKVVNKDVSERMKMPSREYIVYPEKYKYSDPVFNPNNKNEIAYIRKEIGNGVSGQPELWTFDFCTGKTRQLAAVISNAADWSVKDWLIYRGAGGELKKIKSNGDSLVTLPKITGATLPPKWNDTGDLFAIPVVNRRGEDGILVASQSGEGVGTFNDFVLRRWDWAKDQICYVEAGGGKQEIRMFNFRTKTSNVIETINDFKNLDSVVLNTVYFKEKEVIFWNQKKKICYTDVLSGKRTVVLKGSYNRWYNNISLSSDGKTIIAGRVDRNKIGEGREEMRMNLVLIDVETGVERMVVLPE